MRKAWLKRLRKIDNLAQAEYTPTSCSLILAGNNFPSRILSRFSFTRYDKLAISMGPLYINMPLNMGVSNFNFSSSNSGSRIRSVIKLATRLDKKAYATQPGTYHCVNHCQP